jgi:hypothetical protein
MSAKIVLTSALALAFVSLAPAVAQDTILFEQAPQAGETLPPVTSQEEPLPSPSLLGPQPTTPLPPSASGILYNGAQPTGTAPVVPYGLSNWIIYNRNGVMNGPMGNHIPVRTEIFLRNGFAVPTSATIVGRTLDTGWDITGGGRLLFFNQPMTRAWTLEASITNIFNPHSNSTGNFHFPLNVIDPTGPTVIVNGVTVNASFLHFGSGGVPGVTVRSLNRTFVNLAPGRVWYLWGSAGAPGGRWRVGVDGGGRWGTAKMELFEFKHRTDTIGAVFAAWYTDLEVPYGCCSWFAGVRGEWDYTFMDILQRTSDVMTINALITAGVRF